MGKTYFANSSSARASARVGDVFSALLEMRARRIQSMTPRARSNEERRAAARARMKQVLAMSKTMTFSQIAAELGTTRAAVSGLSHRYSRHVNPHVTRTQWWQRRAARRHALRHQSQERGQERSVV